MSRRGLIPLALAVGFGIANGYVTFNPAFQEKELEKLKKEDDAKVDLGPSMKVIPVIRAESPKAVEDRKNEGHESEDRKIEDVQSKHAA